MDKDTTDSYTVTLGINGMFGEAWDYDASFTRNETKLKSRNFVRYADAVDGYFEKNVLGPQLGEKEFFVDGERLGLFPIYRPNYDAFFSTDMTPADLASFSGYGTAHAKTWDDLFRAQLTNTSLFSLPGGDAGLAVAVEAGNEGWDYQPIPGIMEGEIWGKSDVAGSAHRTRYAGMTELRLPVASMLSATVSGRYDAFDAYGTKVDKPTWSVGLEFRPIESLLIRGKYGTAFKAPTLPDQFQGESGFYSSVTDYYRCGQEGFTPADTLDCKYDSQQYAGLQKGNPDLKPITADTWSIGAVWAPTSNFSLGADFYSWDIKNEVDQIGADDIMREEYYCRRGEAGPGIVSCDNVAAWISRDASGQLVSIETPRVNVARQKLQLFTINTHYLQDIGRFGQLMFTANYTNKTKHERQPDVTQDYLDLLNSPNANWAYDAGPKWKADGSIGWNIGKWTTTLYANMMGATPNYQAAISDDWNYVDEDYGVRAGKWGTYTTFNLGVDYQALDNLSLSLQVNNLGNKMPTNQAHNYPGTETTPYNEYLYSVYGRSIFAELHYNFGK